MPAPGGTRAPCGPDRRPGAAPTRARAGSPRLRDPPPSGPGTRRYPAARPPRATTRRDRSRESSRRPHARGARRRPRRPRPRPASHRASRSCMAARSGRPIARYAARRTSGCTNSCSPALGRTSRCRASDASRPSSSRSSGSGVIARSSTAVNSRPATAARESTSRSPGSSASMRLASSASSVDGTRSSSDSPTAPHGPRAARGRAGRPRRRSRIVSRQLVVDRVALGQRVDEAPRVLGRQRSQADRALAPRRALLEELGTRHRDDEERPVDGADDVLDQVEERRHRPVHVVEDDDDGARPREVLDERTGRRERRIGARELAQRWQRRRRPPPPARPEIQERQERDALAVGDARRAEHDRRYVVRERLDEPALADARLSDDDDVTRQAVATTTSKAACRAASSSVRSTRGAAVDARSGRVDRTASSRPSTSRSNASPPSRAATAVSWTSSASASCSARRVLPSTAPTRTGLASQTSTRPVPTAYRAGTPRPRRISRSSTAARAARTTSSSWAPSTPKATTSSTPDSGETTPP